MCHPATLVVVTLLACAVAAAALPASNDKVNNNVARPTSRERIKKSPMFLAQRHVSDAPTTRKPVTVRYCQFPTPCAWKIMTYADYAEISLINEYCVCRSNQKCKFYARHLSEGYSEYRCM